MSLHIYIKKCYAKDFRFTRSQNLFGQFIFPRGKNWWTGTSVVDDYLTTRPFNHPVANKENLSIAVIIQLIAFHCWTKVCPQGMPTILPA